MRTKFQLAALAAAVIVSVAAAGCGEHDHDHNHSENEVITTVTLTFTPAGGGAPIVASVNDPDGDGGDPPTIQPVMLGAGMFDLGVKFENRKENPPEDITLEIEDEGDHHQVFFTGTAVSGPASNQTGAPLVHSYADTDAKGLPIGLANKVTAARGTGMLTVTLRHMPPINNMVVKSATLADMVRTNGFAGIGGSTDAQVTFPVTVQ
jgi:hypothetical protein